MAGTINLRTANLPFSAIPHQSLLFTQYQNDPLSLTKYYPYAVAKPMDVASRIPDVLSNYTVNRAELCDALEQINRAAGSGERSLGNIHLLREPDTVAVVTGQQAGLFTGPLYTIYKALSAIKMAECLSKNGQKAVPVFWIATEDHDFKEVSTATVRGREGKLDEFAYRATESAATVPVGDIGIDDSISDVIDKLITSLPPTEFSVELKRLLTESYLDGEFFGKAFARLLAALFRDHGLILIDPLHAGVKKLAGPIYVKAIERSEAIVVRLVERSRELISDGFHAQVLVEDDYFPLFWHTDSGERTALRNAGNGVYRSKADRREFTLAELGEIAGNEPSRFSPGVMLRPVVQDYLLPTICYFGGGAEVAYFAQNSEVYRILERPATTILHRQSFTIVEAKHGRTMEKFGLEFADLFNGRDDIRRRIVDEYLSPETPALFADVEERINTELNRLNRELSQVDPTLAENLATRRRKIIYHIAALRNKAYDAHVLRDETLSRQLDSMFDSLLPNGHLQERTLNIATFFNNYGPYFIEWMYAATDINERSHQIVYL